VSQPVLEACLRLPSYVLAPGGADRGLARAAFASLIAPKVLERRSKGRTNSYLAHILLRHRCFLRTFLLDGALAEADMIARAPLAAALSEEGLIRHAEHHARLVGFLGVEAWLRKLPAVIAPAPAAST
jgi:asparagine synthase (glutamine-hydrolysing)